MEIGLNEIETLLDTLWDAFQEKNDEWITPHIYGPAGTGKSTAVKEWSRKLASKLGKEWVDYDTLTPRKVREILSARDKYFVFADLRTTSILPEDLQGLPNRNEDMAYFVPLDLAKLLSEGAGVLVLDEFSDESRPNMQAALKKLVRERRLGGTALSPQVFIVAISNSIKHSLNAHRLPIPLKDRFVVFDVRPPTVDEWAKWMNEKYVDDWDKRTLAYLSWKPSDISVNTEEEEVKEDEYLPPATPRGWSYVAHMLKHVKDEKLAEALIRGKLGQVGERLIAFLEVTPPTFDEITKKPEILKQCTTEELVMAAFTIAENAEKEEAYDVIKYMLLNINREIVMLTIKLMSKQNYLTFFVRAEKEPAVLARLRDLGSALI
jgi:hypothetical protein